MLSVSLASAELGAEVCPLCSPKTSPGKAGTEPESSLGSPAAAVLLAPASWRPRGGGAAGGRTRGCGPCPSPARSERGRRGRGLRAHAARALAPQEGKAASLAADFSITQFAHVGRLLMVHGRRSYKRSAALGQFVMHRGLLISTMQVRGRGGGAGGGAGGPAHR